MKVPITKPLTGKEEIALITEVMESGWLTQGPKVTDFENAVVEFTGAGHAVACSNCTTALHLALMVHGIGSGDEVIVPSYTWIATPNSVCMVGARPLFADIDISTFNLDPGAVERAITKKTKAIMVVHQFGLPADMESINRIAAQHGLIVIEDAACALGSRYYGRYVGSLESIACFSFHPRKLISTGEGGMLVTADGLFAAKARMLLNHGASIADTEKHKAGTVEALLSEQFDEVGYNYRITNIQGAVGTVQMSRLKHILESRKRKADVYTEAFRDMPEIIVPHIPGYAEPNWQSYAIRLSGSCPVTRNTAAQRLLDAGIACRPAYMACHVQPVYRRMWPGLSLPATEKALESVIILPLYPQMTVEEQEYVIAQVRKAVHD